MEESKESCKVGYEGGKSMYKRSTCCFCAPNVLIHRRPHPNAPPEPPPLPPLIPLRLKRVQSDVKIGRTGRTGQAPDGVCFYFLMLLFPGREMRAIVHVIHVLTFGCVGSRAQADVDLLQGNKHPAAAALCGCGGS